MKNSDHEASAIDCASLGFLTRLRATRASIAIGPCCLTILWLCWWTKFFLRFFVRSWIRAHRFLSFFRSCDFGEPLGHSSCALLFIERMIRYNGRGGTVSSLVGNISLHVLMH